MPAHDDDNRLDDDEDEEDEDYVPQAEAEEDEEYEEDEISDDPDAPASGKRKGKSKGRGRQRRSGSSTLPRKRLKGGIMLSDDEEGGSSCRPKVTDVAITGECRSDDREKESSEKLAKEDEVAPKPAADAPKPKSKVDDFWEEMKRGASSTAKSTSSSTSSLAQILGQRGTASSSGNISSLIQNFVPKASSQAAGSSNILSMFPQTVTKKDTYTVKQVAEFAGERITVEKQIEVGSAEDVKLKSGPKKTNLDGLLERLSGKGKSLSTKAKTEHDWAAFKAKEGLEEELSTYRKNGYIDKMGFLARSDARKEELLREDRDAERRARARLSGPGD